MQRASTNFLDEPRVEVLRSDEGQPEAVLVRLRGPTVQAVRAVQPNRDVMVDFYLDADSAPVSIVLHESVSGPALVNTVEKIIHRTGRKSVGAAGREGLCLRTGKHDVAYLLRAFFEGLRHLPSHPSQAPE